MASLENANAQPRVHSVPILKVDYENGRPNSGVADLSVDPPRNRSAITMTREAPRSGKFSLRTQVGVTPDYISDGKPRAESAALKNPKFIYHEGETWEYEFSVKLDKSWQIDPNDIIEILWQCKPTDSEPDIFLAVKRDKIVLRNHCSDEHAQTTLVDLTQTPPGEWLDFKFEIHWSPGPNGHITCFYKTAKDSEYVKLADISAPNQHRNLSSKGGYMKWGLYRPQGAATAPQYSPRIVYHDDIRATRLSK